MIFKNRQFAELPGTVYVVVIPTVGMICAVFKTLKAAKSYQARALGSEVRVGHFNGPNEIVTI